MPAMEIILPVSIILLAYFVKGLSGFGPALIMIPFLTMIYDPSTAIVTTTLFDFLAGLVLFYRVRKQIEWPFIIPIIIMMAAGATLGAYLLGTLPEQLIKQVMGVVIALFAIYIMIAKEKNISQQKKIQWPKYPIGMFSGILGGFLGMSGPPLIIYMKLNYAKSFFRTQLIGVFLFGAGWRLLLYQMNNIKWELAPELLIFFVPAMLAGVFAGDRIQLKISETQFNRIVASIILLTAVKLILF